MEAGGDAELLSEHASRQDLLVHELAEVSRIEILRSIKSMNTMNAGASHLDASPLNASASHLDTEKDGEDNDTDWRRRTVVPMPKEGGQMRWAALSAVGGSLGASHHCPCPPFANTARASSAAASPADSRCWASSRRESTLCSALRAGGLRIIISTRS